MITWGFILLGVTIVLAFVANYYMNVKTRNEYGVKEVSGFWSYFRGLAAYALVWLALNAMFLFSVYLIAAGGGIFG